MGFGGDGGMGWIEREWMEGEVVLKKKCLSE